MSPPVRAFVLNSLFGVLLLMLGVSLYQRTLSSGMVQSLPARGSQAAAMPSGDVASATQQMRDSLPSVSGNPESAAKLAQLMENVKNTPNDPELLLTIAGIFLDGGAWREADSFLARAVRAAPKDFRPYYFVGMSKSRQELYPEAAQAFEESLQREANPATQFNLAILYKYHLNQQEKAELLLREVSITPTASPLLRDKARQELEKK